MSELLFEETKLLGFSSSKPMPYGHRITALGEPKNENGEWAVMALLSSGAQERIYLDDDTWNDKSVIVLRHHKCDNGRYFHEAVSTYEFEATLRRVEDSISKLLQV